MNEQTHFFIKIYLSHFILERVDVGCVWEMSWRQGQTAIVTQQYFFLILAGLLNRGSLQADSHAGILSPTGSSWLELPLAPGYRNVLHPPASTVLPLIYTGASLDWWLGRGSICYKLSYKNSTQHFLLWQAHEASYIRKKSLNSWVIF